MTGSASWCTTYLHYSVTVTVVLSYSFLLSFSRFNNFAFYIHIHHMRALVWLPMYYWMSVFYVEYTVNIILHKHTSWSEWVTWLVKSCWYTVATPDINQPLWKVLIIIIIICIIIANNNIITMDLNCTVVLLTLASLRFMLALW